MVTRLLRLLRRLRDDRSGLSLVEFAFVMPLLALAIMGGTEVGRLVLLDLKLDRLSTATSDLVAQEDELSAADLTNIFAAGGSLTWPFDVNANGVVIVSSVGLVSNQPRIHWQRACPGSACTSTGTMTQVSRIGTQGGTATLPTGLLIVEGDNIIVAEVFYHFTPVFWEQISERDIYHVAFTRPRLSNLTTID